MSAPYSGWRLVLAWLAMMAFCVGVWYLLLTVALYPYAEVIGNLFRLEALS